MEQELIEKAKKIETMLNELYFTAMGLDIQVDVRGKTEYLQDGKRLVTHHIELTKTTKIL
jgi:hypothetical protein